MHFELTVYTTHLYTRNAFFISFLSALERKSFLLVKLIYALLPPWKLSSHKLLLHYYIYDRCHAILIYVRQSFLESKTGGIEWFFFSFFFKFIYNIKLIFWRTEFAKTAGQWFKFNFYSCTKKASKTKEKPKFNLHEFNWCFFFLEEFF